MSVSLLLPRTISCPSSPASLVRRSSLASVVVDPDREGAAVAAVTVSGVPRPSSLLHLPRSARPVISDVTAFPIRLHISGVTASIISVFFAAARRRHSILTPVSQQFRAIGSICKGERG